MKFSYKYSKDVMSRFNTHYQFIVDYLSTMISLNKAIIYSKKIDNMRLSPKCTISGIIEGDERVIVITANGISVK